MISSGPLFLALGLGLCFIAVGIVVVVLPVGRSGIALSRRRPGAVESPNVLTKVANSASGLMDRAVGDKANFGRRDALEQAGIKMGRAEFNLLILCASVLAGLIGFLLAGILVGILFLVLGPLGAIIIVKILTGRRRAKFDRQLGDTLQMLSGGLRAGHSLLRSIDAVSMEAESPTSEEFARVIAENRLGRDLKDSLADTAQRLQCEDFDWTAQAIEIHREVGGDLAEVLDHVAGTIRERAQIKGQVRALSAEGRLSAYILIGLPIGMFFFLQFANPSYLGVLFTTLPGWIMTIVGIVELALGWFWLSRVIKIKF
ncbi:type II secretion system F family protein [Arthrobacter sp. ISL-30]|uniref:type II secretion system F family protein n=1 Tax=Arthrobacter sp. ISL-30 TaxID=2819109 RepID=UPI001BEC8391|nr:type II secretion system F family protein [Arthrobacter sp. ISL-30]MBT2514380.1 type II secretion system F family protein [Arthrobacter sp. ISL-30]